MIKNIALASMVLFTMAQAKDYGTVNGESITDTDISITMAQSGMEYESLDDTMKKRVLDMVVERKLLTQAAEKSGIEKSEAYTSQLKSLKRDLALDIWMKKEMKALEDALSKETLEKFYKDNEAKFKIAKKLQARHILIMADEKMSKEEQAKAKEKAEALIKELDTAKDKKAKFIELAKSKSEGPSGKSGGDLGWFELGRMVPEFSAAADKLKVGEYTKTPVQTQFGFHLIMLDGKKEASVKAFDVVEEEIKSQLSGEAFAGKMKEKTDALKKSAKIELK
ncbi:MAG: Peptidyl-prolyl cis-trans isomerase PpiD [uncultured Sulfurovum sp.]|uniref:Peptidyl-prolyl cis-trans isomerase PpiD n=1 Tax=uncultured Sulfurovum sp. TaxID=269237 RepID=A0A6S6TI91_9BACT|nr:MAG: Peptidyl-prolyl cis-trans isomerase PpiD [uncultured Sulfurovum sp.]